MVLVMYVLLGSGKATVASKLEMGCAGFRNAIGRFFQAVISITI